MIIGVVGVGKARGVTTVALGIAAAAAQNAGQSLIVEADPAGGDVGYWRDVAVHDHGVLEAAAAMGSVVDLNDKATALAAHVWDCPEMANCSYLPLGAAGELSTQVATLWAAGHDLFCRMQGAVVFDFGRWVSQGPVSAIWSGVDAGVVVCDGSLAGLKRAHAAVSSPPLRSKVPTWTVVNGSGWSVGEIRERTGIEFADVLTWDRKGASALRAGKAKAVRRSELGRELSSLTVDVLEVCSGVK